MRADQRALADVREADEGDVGHQLQLELQPALLAVLALLGERRAPAACSTRTWRCRARPGRPAPRSQRSPWLTRSASSSPVYRSLATVPSGTIDLQRSRRACRAGPCPCRGRRLWPGGADGRETRAATPRCGRPPARRRHPCRRRRRWVHRTPRDPHDGTTTQPAPPSPPRTFSCASSTNPLIGPLEAIWRCQSGKAGVVGTLVDDGRPG